MILLFLLHLAGGGGGGGGGEVLQVFHDSFAGHVRLCRHVRLTADEYGRDIYIYQGSTHFGIRRAVG